MEWLNISSDSKTEDIVLIEVAMMLSLVMATPGLDKTVQLFNRIKEKPQTLQASRIIVKPYLYRQA